MSQKISYREYWAEIASLAQSVAEEARTEDCDPWDRLHETLDGHEWVIYTGRNLQVLYHCGNHDAATDEGMKVVDEDGNINWAILAYCAMHADVSERLQDALDKVDAA